MFPHTLLGYIVLCSILDRGFEYRAQIAFVPRTLVFGVVDKECRRAAYPAFDAAFEVSSNTLGVCVPLEI